MSTVRQDVLPMDRLPLTTVVSLSVRDSTVGYVVRTLARQANIKLVYDNSDTRLSKRITVQIIKMPLMSAMTSVLRGTGLVAKMTASGETIMLRSDTTVATSRPISTTGKIVGQVVDSSTGYGVSGAAVVVDGLPISKTTNESGKFVLSDIPVGNQTLRIKAFGYKSAVQSVTVSEGNIRTVRIVLIPSPTTLSGVVTTVTGVQRRVEIGNDITTLKVDSILQAMPVTSLTDLLATRVPGLEVMPTSGSPGAPSRLRIRGTNSVSLSNDPIVIVDGVRVYAAQIERSRNSATSNFDPSLSTIPALVPSPLDRIDPFSIETVEVLKGPSAVALYGTDAANGVIVVTTKRGKPGPTRFQGNVAIGRQTVPGKWPTNYLAVGKRISHIMGDMDGIACSISDRLKNPWVTLLGYSCAADSIVTYSILNDPRTTVFGTGLTQLYQMGISGGTSNLTYSLTGAAQRDIGYLKMPDADVSMLSGLGLPPADWMRRPEVLSKQSGQGKIQADVGQGITVILGQGIGISSNQTTPLHTALYRGQSLGSPLDQTGVIEPILGSGILQEIPQYRNRITSQSLTSTTSLNVQANFRDWINAHTTMGIDLINRRDRSTLGRGECESLYENNPSVCNSNSGNQDGFINVGQGISLVKEFQTRISVYNSLTRWLSFKTSVGGNMNSQLTHDLNVEARDIPVGATSGNLANIQESRERLEERRVAGIWAETQINIADRFYFPISTRRDVGNGLGPAIRPTLPRLQFSYILSDQPGFREIPLFRNFSLFRVRTAFGVSGRQPNVQSVLRTYSTSSTQYDGERITTVNLNSVGNSELKPERTVEWEYGFETDFWNERIGLTFTAYRQKTFDLLITKPVPVSTGANVNSLPLSQQHNIGDVINSGTEISLRANIIRQRALSWSFHGSVVQTRNKLVKLGLPNALLASGTTGVRYVEGYPLDGFWQASVVGYADLDGDGILAPYEKQLSDSVQYVGGPAPRITMNIFHDVLLAGKFTFGANFSYENGKAQRGLSPQRRTSIPEPLLFQVQSGLGVQKVVTLRFESLSIGMYVPTFLTQRILRNRTLHVKVQGINVGLWSNYRGKDPDVNNRMQEYNENSGVLPKPRTWQISVGIL